jgi:hypothetical protein
LLTDRVGPRQMPLLAIGLFLCASSTLFAYGFGNRRKQPDVGD